MGEKRYIDGRSCKVCDVPISASRRSCVCCSPECSKVWSVRLKSLPIPGKACKVCGGPMPKSRHQRVTCSDKCASKALEVNNSVMRQERVELSCQHCGNNFEASPSGKGRKFCSRACQKEHARESMAKHSCSVCGAEFYGTRKTCSKECLRKLYESMSRIGVRTPEQRKRKREAERKKYKGKDKAELISRMTEQQKGRCASCGDKPSRLVFDHDHDTGHSRGMLCVQCNVALGCLKDSPLRIEKLKRYANRWQVQKLPLASGFND